MKSKGFTLIELLVVISIIAILATISISVFSTAQRSARDGKRLADLDTIARSLEASKDYTSGDYYNNLSADFPKGVPSDPTSGKLYCLYYTTATAPIPTLAASVSWTIACPIPTPTGVTNAGLATPFPTPAVAGSGVKNWMICASKENPNVPICQNSLQR